MILRAPLVRAHAVLVAVLVASASAAGCSGAAPRAAESAEEAYARGAAAFEARRWDRAAEHFRAALDFGRGSGIADEAQYYLARAYFEDGQYLLAGAEFTRFAELYPADSRVEDVEFERIRAYYRLSPPYQLDQTDTERAIEYIRLFAARHPESPRTAEAVALLEELQGKLARKLFEAGRLYERRELYEAAVLTYRSVLEQHPTSTYADDAMLGMLRAQVLYADASIRVRQGVRYGEALAFYDRLVQLFPNSPVLPEAQALYDRAFAGRRAVEPTTPPAEGQAQG